MFKAVVVCSSGSTSARGSGPKEWRKMSANERKACEDDAAITEARERLLRMEVMKFLGCGSRAQKV